MQRTKRRLVVCEQSAFKQTLPVILIYYKVSQPLLYTVMSFFLYLRVIYFTPWYFSVVFPFPIMWQCTIIHLFATVIHLFCPLPGQHNLFNFIVTNNSGIPDHILFLYRVTCMCEGDHSGESFLRHLRMIFT